MYQCKFGFNSDSGKIKFIDYSNAKDTTTSLTNAKIGEWFDLRIEYYDMDDGSIKVKIFVAGELISVSQKYYHVEHKSPVNAGRFGSVRITANAGFEGKIYFDEVSVLRVQKEYVDEEPKDNTVKIPEVHTYDDFDDQIDASYTYSANKSSTGTLVQKTDDKGNKYICFSKVGTEEQSSLSFVPTLSTDGANVFVFETDICISRIGNNGREAYVALYAGSTVIYHAYFTVNDGELKFNDFYKNSSGQSVLSTAALLKVKPGEWFRFRLEFHEGKRDTLAFKAYANGEEFYNSKVYFPQTGAVVDAESVSRVSILPGMRFTGEILLDNTSLKSLFIEKEEDPTEKPTSPINAITYDDPSVIGSTVSYSVSGTEGSVTIAKDGNNSILHFAKPGGGGNPSVSFNSQSNSGDIFVFESDIKMERTSSEGDIYFIIYSGDTPVYYTWFSFSGSSLIFNEYNSNKAINSVSDLGIIPGEWFNLRIEYVGGDRDTLQFNIYVDGDVVYTSSYYYSTSGSVIAPGSVTRARLNYSSSCHGNIYLDNTAIGHMSRDNEESGETVIDFESGVPASVLGSSGSKVTHTVVDTGDGNKALRVQKSSTGWVLGGLFVKVQDEEEYADTFIFECDMLVTSFYQMAVYITDPDTMTTGNVNYANYSSGNSDKVMFGTVSGPVGEWVHFKLEYTKVDGKGQSTITIGDSTEVIVKADTINLENANIILFAVQSATIHDVIYDNIVCKKICKIPE